MGFELVELALLHAVPYLGDELLGAEGEVGLHHPVVVGGFLLKDFDDGFALVFAEVEYFALACIIADMSGEVSPLLVVHEVAECGDVADDEL